MTDFLERRILQGMSAESAQFSSIASVAPADFPAMLELVFSRLDRQSKKVQIETALEEIRRGGDESQIALAARRGEQMRAAVWLQIQPGGVGSLWPPAIVDGEPEATANVLVELATAKAEQAGVGLIQSLLETDAGREAHWLKQAKFHHAADLLYLVSRCEAFPTSAPNCNLLFEPLADIDQNRGQFSRLAQIVERTYEGTLDCPAVQGVRSMTDVLAGYRAVGEFDPSRWFIVREQNDGQNALADVGCLLLTNHPAQKHWELVYMGVAPEARGRGLGVELVRRAQWLAGNSHAERLVLAVDAANRPAISAYSAAGFETWDRRSVFLRLISHA